MLPMPTPWAQGVAVQFRARPGKRTGIIIISIFSSLGRLNQANDSGALEPNSLLIGAGGIVIAVKVGHLDPLRERFLADHQISNLWVKGSESLHRATFCTFKYMNLAMTRG